MKKITLALSLFLLGLLGIFSNASCSKENEDGIKIVSTIFPFYDWTREITKNTDKTTLKYVVNSGIDLHSYTPSLDDIITIGSADILIYAGGESDEWIHDALKQKTNQNMVEINLIELLGNNALEEEDKEGMEQEEESLEEAEFDEHVWLSIKNTKTFVSKITEEIISKDEKNKSSYEKNKDDYLSKLDALDQRYEQTIKNGNTKTLLFGDRFPFLYMVKDYNLDYFAAFKGCSAEAEASFETVMFLTKKVDDLNLKVILTIDNGNTRIAESIKNNSKEKNQQILSLNSMQSISKEKAKNVSYLSIMEENLKVIQTAVE